MGHAEIEDNHKFLFQFHNNNNGNGIECGGSLNFGLFLFINTIIFLLPTYFLFLNFFFLNNMISFKEVFFKLKKSTCVRFEM